jgi:hypothetical protein
MLREELTLDEIKNAITNARVEYQAAAPGRDTAEAYARTLEGFVVQLDEWKLLVDNQVEQVPSGRFSAKGKLPITHPKEDDPYYRLLQQRGIPLIIEIGEERDKINRWLSKHHN